MTSDEIADEQRDLQSLLTEFEKKNVQKAASGGRATSR